MNATMSKSEMHNREKPGSGLLNTITSSICVISAYLFIASVITYPLIFKINHCILGSFGGYGDLSWELWLQWVVKNSIGNPGSLYFIDIAHYPVGVSVLKDSANFLIPFLSSLLQSIFKLTTSYNLLCLLALTLNGLGAYLLMRYLLKDGAAAFVCGVIYAFNPYIITEITYGRLIQANAVWIPLYVLFLVKTFNENSSGYSMPAASFLLLACLSSWYYGFFLIVFTIVFVLYRSVFDKDFSFASFKKIVIIILLFAIMASPFVYSLIISSSSFSISGFFHRPSLWEKVFPGRCSTRLIPIVKNSLGPGFPFRRSFIIPGISHRVSIIVILLSFIPLFFKNKRPKFWVFSSVFFYFLCLGPYMKAEADPYLMVEEGIYQMKGVAIPLPYLFLFRFFPFFWILRWPGRFAIMLTLSLMVLAGSNLLWIFERFKATKLRKFLLSVGLTCLLVLEIPLLSLVGKFPIPLSRAEAPLFYYELAREKDCAIIQYPFFFDGACGFYPGATTYGYYQTIHGKKTLTGPCDLTKRYQAGYIEFIYSNSFIQSLLNLQTNPACALSYRKGDIGALKKIGFKYLVVNHSLFESKILGIINDKLESVFGKGRTYPDGITVYSLG